MHKLCRSSNQSASIKKIKEKKRSISQKKKKKDTAFNGIIHKTIESWRARFYSYSSFTMKGIINVILYIYIYGHAIIKQYNYQGARDDHKGIFVVLIYIYIYRHIYK